jgi:serine/threonine protein kinase
LNPACDARSFQWSGWEITQFQGNGSMLESNWQERMVELFPRFQKPEAILKHDHRGLVGIFNYDGVRYAIKQFTIQSTWLWFQLTSIMFPSLGEIAFRNAVGLLASGIATPTPVMLLQRRCGGMVKESWLIYRFLPGETLTPADGEEIVKCLKSMHLAGWIHRDPHPGNFLRTPEGIATVDPLKMRRSQSRYLQAYDLVLLAHDIPEAPQLYDTRSLGRWFAVAKQGHRMLRVYRQGKQGIRKLFRLKAIS